VELVQRVATLQKLQQHFLVCRTPVPVVVAVVGMKLKLQQFNLVLPVTVVPVL
jgi:hypothetical protein